MHIDHDWKPSSERDYDVLRIANTRLNNGHREYEVVWDGYLETTCEPIEMLLNCLPLLTAFLEENFFYVSLKIKSYICSFN